MRLQAGAEPSEDHLVMVDGQPVGLIQLSSYDDHPEYGNELCPYLEVAHGACGIVPVCTANVASWRMLLAAGFRLVAHGDLEPDNPIDNGRHEILRPDRPA